MDDYISVIIPVYNVARYLPECMESILNQTYDKLEIILIDDGSTDNSGKICDSYAAQDRRIKVIHQTNAGAGAAKNTGLRNATGVYLAFLDSDDFLEKDAFEYMLNELLKEDADVIQCNYCDVYKDKKIEAGTIEHRDILDVEDYLKLYTNDWTAALLWDKLYKRKIFQEVLFETNHIVDDEFFTYRGIMNAKKIIRDPKIVYNYRKRRSSVTLKPEYRERIVLDKLDYLIPRRKRIINRFPELKKIFDKNLLYMLCWLSVDPYITEQSISQIKKIIKELLIPCLFCGAEWNVYVRLIKILLSDNQKIILERKQSFDSIEIDSCFE